VAEEGEARVAVHLALQEPGDLLSDGLPTAATNRADQPSYPHPDHDLPAIDRHVPHRPVRIMDAR
jgi:hypothetical protein